MKNSELNVKNTGRLRKPRPAYYHSESSGSMIAAESPLLLYGASFKVQSVLGGIDNVPENNLNAFQKIALVDEGISKKAVERLKDRAGWDYNQLADILGVARAKLIAKKGNERFDKQVSEKIMGLADLMAYGYEVFEDENRFNAWIFSSNHALGGLAPFDYLDTQFGREEIKDLIGRIDYGVYS